MKWFLSVVLSVVLSSSNGLRDLSSYSLSLQMPVRIQQLLPSRHYPVRTVLWMETISNPRENSNYRKTTRAPKYNPTKRQLRTRQEATGNSVIDKVVQLIRSHRTADALEYFFSGQSAKLKVKDCNILLKELGDIGDFSGCAEVLQIMEMHEVRPTIVTFSTIISRAGAWKKLNLAEKYFNSMIAAGISPDVQAYNSLINAYAKAGDPEKALEVLKSMEESNVIATVITFNTLIDSCARKGLVTKAQEMLSLMKARQLQPNDRSFSSLIHACCQAGDISLALNLFEDMQREGLTPTKVTYSVLLHGLGTVGDLKTAFSLLEKMKARGLLPNFVIMSSLIHACGLHGMIESAFDLFSTMLNSTQKDFQPNSITCSSLVDMCLKAGQIDRAFGVVQIMRERKYALTEVTYTSLIAELTRLGQLDRILEVIVGEPEEGTPPLAKVRSSTRPVFPISAKTIGDSRLSASDYAEFFADDTEAMVEVEQKPFEDLVEKYRESSNHEGVVNVFESMKANGVEPNAKVYNAVMNSIYENSTKLLPSTPEMWSASATGATALSLISHEKKLHRQNELFRMYLVFQEMRIAGVQPDAGVYNSLINACAGSGDLDKAFETIEAMHSEGIDPDVITYTSLMKACCTVGGCRAVEIAEETFHAMQQRTNHFSTYVMPNERTYSWLIHTHLRVDGVVNSKRTTELLLEMSERNLQPELITYSFCIKAACLNGDVDSAILILDRIRNNSKIRYDAKCWQSVLSLCEQKQKIGLCRLVKEEMSVNSNFY